MSFRIAIDTGGTFTDAISVNSASKLITAKAPTTPKDLKLGTINAIEALARLNGLGLREFLSQVTTIVHGTTLGTNTILTRSGPRIGIIASEGHADVIRLRRVPKAELYNWRMPQPEPLVERYLCVEVEERIGSRGEIVKPLNEASVRKAVARLRKLRAESIVVALLWSFLHPDHERRVGEIIREEHPEADVTLSHEIWPALGEHERTSTAVISAYIAPAIRNYTLELEALLEQEGFEGQLLFMQNNGGVQTPEIALQKPATLALSGPAAGPAAALGVGRPHRERNLLSVDMGGTSFDIAIIHKDAFLTKTESLVGEQRFSLPVIDIDSLGAGGGSIAWFDATGTLRVGPKSAGSDPGPACYGAGGEEATTTDANVVLGYISPDYFLGGEMPLRKELAEKAVRGKVAGRLGVSVPQAAAAIYRVANSLMANAVSTAFAKRGFDPRDFLLVAGGAATPTCALELAQELGIRRVAIPKYAPIYCAFGMLGVDLRHDFARFYHTVAEYLDLDHVRHLYGEMEAEALAIMAKEEIPEKQRRLVPNMRVKYFGQFRDIEVSLPEGPITEASIEKGLAAFHVKHKDVFGYSDPDYPVEYMGFGLSAIGKIPPVRLKRRADGSRSAAGALKGHRDAYFEESGGFVKTKVYDGDQLSPGAVLEGPCIVEERMTNVVVPPTFELRVDGHGNYLTA